MIIRMTISNYLLFQIHFQIPSVFMFLSFILFFQTQTVPWIVDLQLLLHFLSERHSLWEKPKKVLLRTCHRISWCNFLEILISDECEDSLVMPSSFPAKTKEFFFGLNFRTMKWLSRERSLAPSLLQCERNELSCNWTLSLITDSAVANGTWQALANILLQQKEETNEAQQLSNAKYLLFFHFPTLK